MNTNYLFQLVFPHKTLKIYDKIYTLPILVNRKFLRLQEKIQARQQLIKKDNRFFPQWLKVFSSVESISFDEQFNQLEKLIGDYQKIISILNQYQAAYQQFFVVLAEDIKKIVSTKFTELYQAERERLELEKKFQDDEFLGIILSNQKNQIFQNTLILYRSAQLMLKKLELISKSIQKISDDQNSQIQILKNTVDDLSSYYQIYQLQKKIDLIEKDIEKLSDIAINFEQHLIKFLNPFQDLITQVVAVDQELLGIVAQISILAKDILEQETTLTHFEPLEPWTANLIEFILKSQEKENRIPEALEEISREMFLSLEQFQIPETILKETSLSKILNSMSFEVENKLEQFSLKIKPEIAAQLAKDYHRQGMNDYLQKDYQRMRLNLTEAIKHNPFYLNAYYNRGLAYYHLEDYDKAIEDYNQALKLDPQSSYAYNGRGFVYYQLKKYDQALEDYNQALTLNPQLIYAYWNRGLSYHQMEKYFLALEDYNKALLLNSQLTDIYLKIGLIKYEIGAITEAIEQWHKVLLLEPHNPQAKLALAVALYHQEPQNNLGQLVQDSLQLEPRLAEQDFLKSQLWGNQLRGDTQKWLCDPKRLN
ncbi:tetratricopeptide repeat protein [Gloeothece verrucosa]|uniref:TPR repeat-containing protein n=1 Tax=Gloeothece verrucosa (strain PCC 7822) TaxID=497965 RepID=E0UIK4_GLOV7|nr:tetratricopeptide repeat protein [Gloeothece verrucosa]ADN12198.1 TPR repeat-containing protein [Gloeothece verrucosa PCC 7822]